MAFVFHRSRISQARGSCSPRDPGYAPEGPRATRDPHTRLRGPAWPLEVGTQGTLIAAWARGSRRGGEPRSWPALPPILVALGLRMAPRSAAICHPASLNCARTQGASDFLLKPFEPGELLRRVACAFADGRS